MPEELKKNPEPPKIEVPRQSEVAPEVKQETTREEPIEIQRETAVPAETTPPSTPAAPAPSAPPLQKDPETALIENILAEGLEDAYKSMPPDLQIKFKAKGEETAGKIRVLIESAKAKAKTILGLIRDWLKMIPGVNKFFLEQEAKIKTDKILARAESEKRK